ncbi:hypothetical protein AVEN_962-1 [Araneus ventricosus]|uniref:Uncharacterized protein n=1 Tax=Araneus ventricosus TaxID=182803 RepID=A0A4Y2CXE1_ARAVE|nr:hypothetical protein AVEN_962-1 [Araneus ventricosus]
MPLISYHNQIETQIENFVENFKKNGSVLISTLNVEAYNNTRTQWTPSDDSATEYPKTSAGCSSYDSSGSDSCSYGEAGNSDNGELRIFLILYFHHNLYVDLCFWTNFRR